MNNLENRCLDFAVNVRLLLKQLPKLVSNYEDSKQVARSSGSIGANYIKANESLGEKDKLMKMRISRKEAKETIFWLTVLLKVNPELNESFDTLIAEASELNKILSSIILKLEN